jgi:hypothetical protein
VLPCCTRCYARTSCRTSPKARNIFRRDYVERLLAEHVSGAVNHQALLMLELWYRMWIDQPAEAALVRPAA